MEFQRYSGCSSKLEVCEHEQDSMTSLIFVPGPFKPSIWKNQIRYFSNQFRTLTYRGHEKYQDEAGFLEKLVSSSENVVLVSFGPGNALAQLMEDHEEVIATVLTNPSRGFSTTERSYKLSEAAARKPKIAKKLFFGPQSDYSTVKKFLKEVGLPDYSVFSDYIEGFGMREPIKDCMMVVSGSDRFSNPEFAQDIQANAGISYLQDSGSFPFYESPEDYNKALFDFMRKVEDFAESKELRQKKQSNKTLETEFENTSLESFAKRDVKK